MGIPYFSRSLVPVKVGPRMRGQSSGTILMGLGF